MVSIPGGSFKMGCVSGIACDYTEKPVHKVSIGAFKMSATEVTFALWDACVDSGFCNHKPGDEGWGRGDRPVINVSFDDISGEFLPWLNKATGKAYRLPTEAEWEYAARAGTATPYSTGRCLSADQANYDGDSTISGCAKGQDRQKTLPVNSFEPNAFGLYDMHGNVWEWAQDCWKDSYAAAPDDGRARTDGDCSRRVIRGGSWIDDGRNTRAANRSGGNRDYRYDSGGFRLAMAR